MSRRVMWGAAGVFVLALSGLSPAALARQARPAITTPLEQLGHNFGDDYFLANYQQIAAYWKKLATESDRIVVRSIGKTAEGRDQLMAIVTSPENQQHLEEYRLISERLPGRV